jgi:glycosyltransferase involved in cell wall biosynthesis
MLNKKYILFLHGGNLPFRYENSHKRVTFIFSKAYKIIAPSLYLKSYFEEKGFIIEHIPNIIELDKYQFKLRENVRPNILAIRGFGKPYNPILTLMAINDLKFSVTGLKLLMLGNNDEYHYRDVINYIEENQIQNIVEVRPKCSRDEWVKISKNYDIMVSNPIIDNTPVSLIEGMALGMCIVSTNVGGVPYILRNRLDSILVNNESVKGLVNGIKNLLTSEISIAEISTNARNKAEEFSWGNVKLMWIKLLTN